MILIIPIGDIEIDSSTLPETEMRLENGVWTN